MTISGLASIIIVIRNYVFVIVIDIFECKLIIIVILITIIYAIV